MRSIFLRNALGFLELLRLYVIKSKFYIHLPCPFSSRAMTLDTYGDANADALTLASVKLKDTFNDNTDYFKLEEEQEDTKEE